MSAPVHLMANAALRAELHDLDLTIAELQARRKQVQARLDSIDYPILILPPEITSEIFLCCLPETRKPDVVNPKEAPLLLTHVCSAWRRIACSTPQLWNTFEVTVRQAGKPVDLEDIAETWFNRAGGLTLSVKYEEGLFRNGPSFARFLPALRRHARKVRSLELHVNFGDLVMIDLPLDCVLLQNLSIHLLDDWGHSEQPHVEMFTNSVPLLREVSMSTAPPSFLGLSWQQLTKFTGELYYVRECLEALRVMPNLTECAFSAFDLDTVAEVFSHANIQHFTLFKSSSSDVSVGASSADPLCRVTLPALQTLKLVEVDNFNEYNLDSFLIRSAAPLRELVVRPSISSLAIQLVLSATFLALSLTLLEIWHPSGVFLMAFLETLAQDANALPSLRTLSFRGCHRDGYSGFAVDDIIDAAAVPITQRRHLAGCAQLQSFRVVSKTHPKVSVYAEARLLPFRELKEAGMDIYIGSEEESII
ncbi:hypothetical protein B0H16DRAFT_1565704 [Mycena metata]|uniref:F-box domain-containing protein n=1 Tax=Mycena metata TaxID=1033252 RepID=A0AAD7N138_9AGAR|nr:hypothetical protein B0H16DRAFT_1565704 [Mycena metata]